MSSSKISIENYIKQFKEKEEIFNSYFNEVTSRNIFPSNYHSFQQDTFLLYTFYDNYYNFFLK